MKQYTFDFYNSTNLKAYNLNQTMRYQLAILDNMDYITKKHSENVANLVCRICEYKGYDIETTIFSTMNAYLHDVGKLSIPSEILNKPERLTDAEFEIMKTHTTKGYEICMKDPKLRPYAQAALYHHEALNGTGYPNGVTKKDIPYIAQIVRIADEYDALVSKRQYKTHVDISEALKIMLDESKRPNVFTTGKINPKILKILFKVVIDDIIYEIACVDDYIKYLKSEIKRLEKISKYFEKINNTKKNKQYYLETIGLMLSQDETIDNFQTILQEYKNTLSAKEENIKKLNDEIKIIQKLKV